MNTNMTTYKPTSSLMGMVLAAWALGAGAFLMGLMSRYFNGSVEAQILCATLFANGLFVAWAGMKQWLDGFEAPLLHNGKGSSSHPDPLQQSIEDATPYSPTFLDRR